MPELPEVETVRKQLKPLILGKKIKKVALPYPGIIKHDIEDFKSKMKNQTFRDIDRYGKYLIFELDNYSLVSHLRMEGKYYIKDNLNLLTKHDHVVFYLDDGRFLTYHDVRKFGTMELVDKGHAFDLESLAKLGPEVNDDGIDIKTIYHKISKSERPIKSLLLDQTIMTGLGNIYVDETLFLAKMHPETKGSSLGYKDVKKIIDSAQKVIKKAISLGGTTIRTYHSTLGIDGLFQNELNVHTLKDQPCPKCQTKIIKIKVGGRGTYLCPQCQRKESL
jgi:formamidopyrimidine-DNA glycosylase